MVVSIAADALDLPHEVGPVADTSSSVTVSVPWNTAGPSVRGTT